MKNSKQVLITFISAMVWLNVAAHTQTANAKPTASRQPLVRLVMVNMSGKSREARVGESVVPLPVAQRVALQVPKGECIKITSSTDQTVARVITAAPTDEGRTIPVD
jgi:hypothetical protein